MSRETVGDEVRSGDLTVEALNTGAINPAGGNVGIGTSSPSVNLHVQAAAGTTNRTMLKLSNNDTGSYADARIQLDANGQFQAALFGQRVGLSSDAVFGIQVANSAIGYERLRIDQNGLITGSGTSLGAWTAYTPTLGGTGWALGDGTATGYYCQIGKVVHFRFDITFGSTSTFGASAALRVSTPVTARNALLFQQIPVVIAYDVSAGKFYQMSAMVASTTGIDLYAYNGGANGEISELRSTNPFTWASGDIIRLQGSVEAA